MTKKKIKPWYAAVEAFGPKSGDVWDSFIRESGLKQLIEVITLDGILCPDVIKELSPEDWQHNIDEDYVFFYFHDLDYLLKCIDSFDRVNILAIIRNPSEECCSQTFDERFIFQGYDLIDIEGGISAITNCGGFEKAFANEELSSVGLLSTFKRAIEVQNLLKGNYPGEPHANCNIWAIWKMKR